MVGIPTGQWTRLWVLPQTCKNNLLNKKQWSNAIRTKIFKDGIKITDQGECLLGSVIGTESFREQYIKRKVEGWIKDIQAAYSAFTKVLSSRWTQF